MSQPLVSPDGQWWWTGTEWIPAPPSGVHPAPAEPLSGDLVGLVPHAGEIQGPASPSVGVPWPLDEHGTPVIALSDWPAGVCPICGSADATQRVSGLIASGTTHSTAIGVTHVGARDIYGQSESGFGRGEHVGKVGGGWQESITGTTTATALVGEFSTPSRPGAPGGGILLFVVTSLAVAFGTGTVIDNAAVVWAAGLGAGIAAAVLLHARRQSSGEYARADAAQRGWAAGHEMLMASYYCSRDHVTFGPGADPHRLGWGPPKDWVAHCFSAGAARA